MATRRVCTSGALLCALRGRRDVLAGMVNLV